MRQGVMRQEQKAHCRISDPILDRRICAGYAPGIKIWLDEPDELAKYSFQKKSRQAAMTFHKRAKANIECKMTATSFITSILVMRQPMRRIYIYIRKNEIFLWVCARVMRRHFIGPTWAWLRCQRQGGMKKGRK